MSTRRASLISSLRRSTRSHRIRALFVCAALALFGAQLVIQEHLTRHELGLAGHVACETCLAAKSLTPLPTGSVVVMLDEGSHSAPLQQLTLSMPGTAPPAARSRGPPALA